MDLVARIDEALADFEADRQAAEVMDFIRSVDGVDLRVNPWQEQFLRGLYRARLAEPAARPLA